MIPEFRKISSEGGDPFGGAALVERLSRWQHPPPGDDSKRRKFEKLEDFLQRLLHFPHAKLEVTHDKQVVLDNAGLRLPIDSFGTGVHELLILLAAAVSLEGSICCIEEPEIHFHPRLQREFVDVLIRETQNIYLVSTHSPTLINLRATLPTAQARQVQVIHTRIEAGATKGRSVLSDEQGVSVLVDLGVKASDLLQANCVVWVEGPSDQIYLKHWLGLVEPELITGIHYSIMFYGGRLLSHVTLARGGEDQ